MVSEEESTGDGLLCANGSPASIPKPPKEEGANEDINGEEEVPLPQRLVRIPIHQAERAQRDQEAAAAETE